MYKSTASFTFSMQDTTLNNLLLIDILKYRVSESVVTKAYEYRALLMKPF